MGETMLDTVENMNENLWKIHAMAELLTDRFYNLKERGLLQIDPNNGVSEPILTIAEIIKEKTSAVIEKTGKLEVYFSEDSKKWDRTN